VSMESVRLTAKSSIAGKTLAEIGLRQSHGLQVAGINRDGQRILNPGGSEKLLVGDDVLVLGSLDQIEAFKSEAGK
jgi:CPA2 family monovalent cation:H+ antiporter-2